MMLQIQLLQFLAHLEVVLLRFVQLLLLLVLLVLVVQ
jgi:hypothetical protein